MKRIGNDNKIFSSPEFEKDKYKFNIIFKNFPSPDLELHSDEENYIFCRGNRALPTWIWTRDNFDKSKIEEIESLITLYLTDAPKNKFTCKKELYDLLIQRNFSELNREDYFEMGFLMCKEVKKPRACDGILCAPTAEDKETLTQYWYNDCLEMNGVDSITRQKAAEDIENFLASEGFFVLKNPQEKIVCMVSYRITNEQAALSHVYTPKEERCRGYAANLIYLVTAD